MSQLTVPQPDGSATGVNFVTGYWRSPGGRGSPNDGEGEGDCHGDSAHAPVLPSLPASEPAGAGGTYGMLISTSTLPLWPAESVTTKRP